jgi:hypothetical protein
MIPDSFIESTQYTTTFINPYKKSFQSSPGSSFCVHKGKSYAKNKFDDKLIISL